MTRDNITTRPVTRYHLRSRANSTPTLPAMLPGTFLAPSIAQTEVSASEVGHTPTSPLTSLSQQSETSEVLRPALYSQVASSIPLVESAAPEVSVTSSTNGILHILSALSLRDKPRGPFVSGGGLANDGEPSQNEYVTANSRPWTEVKYNKRARSPTQSFECTGEQLDALDHSLARSVRSKRPQRNTFKGEGTSQMKGKTVDPRNWGAADIPNSKLDPELQRRALEFYAKYHR